VHTMFRRRLSYANVMSTLALFVALGGSSYAALSIDGGNIERRSIAAVKIKRNSITGREVRESRLRVPRARHAERLGGFSAAQLMVRCPRDTFPTADVCVERTPRAATPYGSAVLQCSLVGTPAAPGRRLPSHDEMLAALGAVDLAAGGELTSNVFPASTRPGRLDVLYVVDEVGGVALTPDTAAGEKPYRCVTDPLN